MLIDSVSDFSKHLLSYPREIPLLKSLLLPLRKLSAWLRGLVAPFGAGLKIVVDLLITVESLASSDGVSRILELHIGSRYILSQFIYTRSSRNPDLDSKSRVNHDRELLSPVSLCDSFTARRVVNIVSQIRTSLSFT